MANAPLPAWVIDGRDGVHAPRAATARHERASRAALHRCRSTSASAFPDPLLGEKFAAAATTVFENDGVRMWHDGDDIAIVGFKTKMHTLGDDVLDGLQRADRRGRAATSRRW